ncbi:hypothetical protein PO878_02340 [Iamia majanohamensis]|uniref:Uncharacterized protein n=1 Tax=Iamia majanohamensis TaxID=467976 RepID=A0AAE9YAI4_9ACTN|nr:hypothetical protein [Iamia majanohamensis]WCO67558.1 hypothetical protein PO878_02340 [Iamia majanohamensis]
MTPLLAPDRADPGDPAGPAGRAEGETAAGSTGRVDRLRRLWVVPAAVVVVAALALLPRVGDGGPGPGEARVEVDGTAAVVRDDGVATTVTDDTVALGPGDVLEVVEGQARFTLAEEVRLEGRAEPSVGGRSGTTVEMGSVPELLAGPLLVEAPTPVRVAAAGSTTTVGPDADGDGAAHLLRRLGLGVGSYAGAVEVDSAGRTVDLPRWRRVEVAAVGAPGPADLPLRYSATDPWDRRFLGDALAIDRQLAPLLRGLSATGAPDLTDPAALRTVVAGLPGPATLAPLLADLPAADDALVLGAVAAAGTGGTFTERWEAAAAFRADGAEWGLVATDQGVGPAALLDRVRDAVDEAFAGAVDADPDEVAAGPPAADGGAGAPTADAALSPAPTTAPPAGAAGTAGGADTGTGSDGAAGARPPAAPRGVGPRARVPAAPARGRAGPGPVASAGPPTASAGWSTGSAAGSRGPPTAWVAW